ncbi:hypothetical protein LTR84_001206 [Exophiala bonariae]|uniref:Uncharacterized protein n=1 Tax=Exophiala bonariae TaxID=1690606 RepID=A0AAV9NT72_9EURO|nr:hypothetical protein LTR84_001206 [Exophiala bonariae]
MATQSPFEASGILVHGVYMGQHVSNVSIVYAANQLPTPWPWMLISYTLSIVIAASSLYFSKKADKQKIEHVHRPTDNRAPSKKTRQTAANQKTYTTASGDIITRLVTGELLISPAKEVTHFTQPKDTSSLQQREIVEQERRGGQTPRAVSKWSQYGTIGALVINTIRSVAVVPIYRNALTRRQAPASSPLVLLLLSNMTIAVQLAGLPLLVAVADFIIVYVFLAIIAFKINAGLTWGENTGNFTHYGTWKVTAGNCPTISSWRPVDKHPRGWASQACWFHSSVGGCDGRNTTEADVDLLITSTLGAVEAYTGLVVFGLTTLVIIYLPIPFRKELKRLLPKRRRLDKAENLRTQSAASDSRRTDSEEVPSAAPSEPVWKRIFQPGHVVTRRQKVGAVVTLLIGIIISLVVLPLNIRYQTYPPFQSISDSFGPEQSFTSEDCVEIYNETSLTGQSRADNMPYQIHGSWSDIFMVRPTNSKSGYLEIWVKDKQAIIGHLVGVL